jgi:prepilin-type processing-associated H-X9-DG protein
VARKSRCLHLELTILHDTYETDRVDQTGFTTTFVPNTKVPHVDGGKAYDIDFNSMREGRSTTLPTYAVVTSRSYHTDGVNVLRMDGSVGRIANSIKLGIWRALGSRSGSEVAIIPD